MVRNSIKAACAALLLGTVTVGVAVMAPSSVAEAAAVRAAVGKALQQAIELAKSGNGNAALAKVKEAEAVGGLSAAEQQMVQQTRDYVSAKTGAGGGATGCKAKFANDYSAGRYRDVVGDDADCLRKAGAYDFQSQLVVAQAYYLMGNYQTAISMLRGMGDSDSVLSLYMASAHKVGDSAAEQEAAERLILKGQSKYWTYALAAAERSHGLKDDQILDVYRIRFLTNNMRNGDDYSLLTKLALQFGYSAEAYNVAKKGADAKALSQADMRLVGFAQAAMQKDTGQLAALTKQAQAAKTGDAAVKLGEKLWGYGKYADALNLVQSGITKGVYDKDGAQVTLGMVQISAGKKSDALKSLSTVKDPKASVVAHLWTLYARSH